MRNTVQDNFISILRQVVCGGEPLSVESITPEGLNSLFALAKKHDMAHLLPDALLNAGLPVDREMILYQYRAVWRYEQQNFALQEISDALEAAQIPFIPLKGAVLRSLYPEPWMRTSADLDILVREEDFSRAKQLLVQHLNYQWEYDGPLDSSFHIQARVHLELHHALVDPTRFPRIAMMFENIWTQSVPAAEHIYQRTLPDEWLYFYHIVHMLKHISGAGGCGIRSLLDLWLLEQLPDRHERQRNELIEQSGIRKFASSVCALAEMWFSNVPHPELEDLEQYILRGGVYGTQRRMAAISRKTAGSQAKYVLRRIFPSYGTLVYSYPIIWRRKWLTPLFWVIRLSKIFHPDSRKRAMLDIRPGDKMEQHFNETIDALMHQLGIW